MTDELTRELVKRGDRAFKLREPMLSFWQELAWQFYPARADFFSERTFGEEFSTHLFDEGPVTMRRDLGNAFSAQLRPRSVDWFRLAVDDDGIREADGVADWLEWASKVVRRFIYAPRTQFVRATKEGDHDFGTFGNAVLSVDLNSAGSGLLYRCHHLKGCAWLENADGVIDTMFREFQPTARQMRQRWPKAAFAEAVENAHARDPETKFTVRHVMMPLADLEAVDAKLARRLGRGGKRFASVYVDKTNNTLLSAEGSHEFRYVVPRWQTVEGWPYAISPATVDALPGARQLQAMARTGIEALEKSIDPPVKAVEGAIRGDINLYAGGTTWVDKTYDERSGTSFELLEVGKNAVLGLQAVDAARIRLADAMLVSKLNLPATRAKTAYETQQLVEEYVRSAIPIFEPLETQYNAPLLDETFDLLRRLGAFGPPETWPKALRSADIEWSFENPLQSANERTKGQVLVSAVQMITGAAQLDPAVRQDFDIREATRDAVRGSGAPESWIRDKGEADEAAEADAEEAAAAKGIAALGAAGQAAGAVGDAAAAMGGLAQ